MGSLKMDVDFDLRGIVVIVGNYGSGKTEVSINLAADRKKAGLDVCIADLDLINPYFRTREGIGPLSKLGIDVIVPPKQYLQADLPILSPVVGGIIRNPRQFTIIDAGGDDAGAMVLASLAEGFQGKKVNMLQVINPFRPFTETVQGCLKMRSRIEKASKMNINGIIGNANLIDDTTIEDIYQGYDFVRSLSKESGLSVRCITVAAELMPEIETSRFSCPLLQIERQLVPPWKRAALLEQ